MHFDAVHRVRVSSLLRITAGFAVLSLLVMAMGPRELQAQPSDSFVVTADDYRRSLRTEGCSVPRTYRARLDDGATRDDSTRFEKMVGRLVGEIGEGGPYDLTPFSFASTEGGVAYTRRISTVSTLPGADSARRRGANYVSIGISAEGSHLLSYFDVKEDGSYGYGRFFSGGSREPDIYDEPQRTIAFPLRMGTSWQTQEKHGFTTDHTVVDSGPLITPMRKVPSLVVASRWENPESDSAAPDQVWFVDDEGHRTASVYDPKESAVITYSGSSREITTAAAPEGFTTHCAYPAGVPVSFPVSVEWTVLHLYTFRKTTGVSLVRDTAAIGKMEDTSAGISTGDTISLGTDDNVLVSLTAFGMDEQPQDYLEDLVLANFSETEVVQPASKRVVNGRAAYEFLDHLTVGT